MQPEPYSWGAVPAEEGFRFALWAPGCESVLLELDGRDMAMKRQADGWFSLVIPGARAGTPYRFLLPKGERVPDPAARAQLDGVHGHSRLVDPRRFSRMDSRWTGRPWTEAVIYELHAGTFTAEGTFRAAAEKLSHLAGLGITVIELMPVAQFAGERGWGYDGVLPYAPHPAYGSPEDLRNLVEAAHASGMMILLDVVYNHFGPEGNYLGLYAPQFFHPERQTPWGGAIAYEREPVRRFFIDNALYWIGEYGFDGLRLDAIDQIHDEAGPHVLEELAAEVRARFPERHVHLVTEDSRNVAHLHGREKGAPVLYTAEWNDDFHNAAHVLLTGESDGYYCDFAPDPLPHLCRCLAEGYAYQGEPSRHAGGAPRGEPSAGLPVTAFVNFLQNHDQVGNRAAGERLSRLAGREKIEVLTAILLLSPHIPMLFMGEEWDETRPFLFFTDFQGELAAAVREGRRREFESFTAFGGAEVPDPNDAATFLKSKLDWKAAEGGRGRERLEFIRRLIAIRRQEIVPRLDDGAPAPVEAALCHGSVLALQWKLRGGLLQLRANLGDEAAAAPTVSGRVLYATPGSIRERAMLQPWEVLVALEAGHER